MRKVALLPATGTRPIDWRPTIVAENFRPGDLTYADAFLDQVWSLELRDIGAQDPSLKPLLNPYAPTELLVCVAGKDDGPDAAALAVARRVLSQFGHHLHCCDDLVTAPACR